MMSGHEHGLRTPLKRARGLGASGNAVGHWWATRLVSTMLVPLTFWFVFEIVQIASGMFGRDLGYPPNCGLDCISTRLSSSASISYGDVILWIASPINAFLLILFTILNFHHAASGMQAVFEDYIHKEGRKLLAIYSVKAICLLLGGACVFSILRIAFGQHP